MQCSMPTNYFICCVQTVCLADVGGMSNADKVRRAVKHLMTVELMKQFNFSGNASLKKCSLVDTVFPRLTMKAIKSNERKV